MCASFGRQGKLFFKNCVMTVFFLFFILRQNKVCFYWMCDLCNCWGYYVLQRRGGDLYFLVASSLDRILMISSLVAWSCSSWCLRASSVLDLQASAWSARSCLRALSAFSLWIYSMIYIAWIYPACGYNPLVFERVTLHLQVQAVINLVISLPRFMASSEQPA